MTDNSRGLTSPHAFREIDAPAVTPVAGRAFCFVNCVRGLEKPLDNNSSGPKFNVSGCGAVLEDDPG